MRTAHLILSLLFIAIIISACGKQVDEAAASAAQTKQQMEQDIAAKEGQLRQEQDQSRADTLLEKTRQSCQEKCTAAEQESCSAASLVTLCGFTSEQIASPGGFIDINQNGKSDGALLQGEPVCESKIACYTLIGSCCAQEITRESCQRVLSDYYGSKGIDAAQISSVVDTMLAPTSC